MKECKYPDPFRPIVTFNDHQTQLNILPTSYLLHPLCSSPSPKFGQPSEVRDQFYFYYFRQRTCVHLSSLLPVTFWNHFVLPMSANSLPVQYAILALAAQHKAYTELGQRQTIVTESQEIYPLSNYGKAIRWLHCLIASESSSTRMVQETLVACLLFICLNILQGNDFGAMTHLNSGLHIIAHLAKSLRGVYCDSDSCDAPISQLIETFQRLDLQAALYLGSHQIRSVATEFGCRPNCPILKDYTRIFQSLEEARKALTEIVLSASHFMRSTAEPLKYLEFEALDGRQKRQRHALHLRHTYIQNLHEWLRSFETYMSGLPLGRQKIEKSQGSKCSISYAQTKIALSVCLTPDETEYDGYLPLFLNILRDAEDILFSTKLSHSQATGLQHKLSPLFDLEVSVIQPLYFTALKCRVSAVRYRAIALMYQTGKEGVWDGALMARIAEHAAKLEENQTHPINIEGTTAILEENRVCGVAINLLRKESKVWIQCSTRRWLAACSSFGNSVTESGTSTEQDEGYVWEFHEDIITW